MRSSIRPYRAAVLKPLAGKECHSLCVSGLSHAGFQIQSRVEALTEHDSELVAGGKPLPDIPAAFLEVADGEINQLGGGIFGRERPARLDRFADDPVQAFDCVCCIDDLSDLCWILEVIG